MSWMSSQRSLIGVVVSAAIFAGTALPAAAQRIPVSQEMFEPQTDNVAMRRKRRGGGNQALGAAILFGAAALGVAAIVASQNRKKRHAYYYAPQHPGYAYSGNAYAPAYHHSPVYYAPQPRSHAYYRPVQQRYYAPQPAPRAYHAPRQRVDIPTGAPPGGYYDAQGGYVYANRRGAFRVLGNPPPAPYVQPEPATR